MGVAAGRARTALIQPASTIQEGLAGASLVFGAGLVIVVLPRMLRSPALAHVLPDPATTAVGVVLTLAAALAGGWLATRLADRRAAR